MRHILIITLSFLLLSSPVIGQSGKPQTIIIPTGSLGEMSKVRIKILEKTLESKLDDYFAIVPKELFEEAQEQAFQEMDSDECTEDQCILMIKEILQIENAFKMDLLSEEGDTQISITWNDQDQKRVEEDYCEGCKTKELRNMIGGLVKKLVGVKDVVKEEPTKKVEPKVVKKPIVNPKDVQENINFRIGSKTFQDGSRYLGELKNEVPHGKGIYYFSNGESYDGIWKDEKPWNITIFNKNGRVIGKYVNGEEKEYNIIPKNGDSQQPKEKVVSGNPDRIGTKTFQDGSRYLGELKNEVPHGKGIYYFSNGESYDGIWKDEKPWNITIFNKNGRIIGKYVNGVKQE